MKHDWEENYRPPGMTGPEQFMSEPYRRCRNCEVVQQLHKEHAWMRIVARRWLPLVGRCQGKATP